jgi:Protein of unknown function (DUF1769)
MAAKIKEKVAHAVEKITSDDTNDCPQRQIDDIKDEKYLLQITAGPSYDESTHRPVLVNGHFATPFENEFMTGNIKVRIRDYKGLPLHAPSTSSYFNHVSRKNEQYSIGFSFVPKRDINAADTLWGNDFDHPVRDRLPPGFNLAVKIVKEFVDPSIELDAYADEPWMYAPSVASFFAFRIGEKKKSLDEWEHDGIPFMPEGEPLEEGADGSGLDVREELQMPEDASTRRKRYRSKEHLQNLTFEAGRLYQADFFNPYIDFGNFSLKLPGLTINCIKYINDKTHKLRYVFKNSATGDLYFSVILTLLFGDDMQEALKDEAIRWANAEAAVHGPSSENEEPEDSDNDEESIPPKGKPSLEAEKAYVTSLL